MSRTKQIAKTKKKSHDKKNQQVVKFLAGIQAIDNRPGWKNRLIRAMKTVANKN